MAQYSDSNERIWKDAGAMARWFEGMDKRERRRADQFALLARLLPFSEDDAFAFLDLGAGAGSSTRTILSMYPKAEAILLDYSPHMMERGEQNLAGLENRYRYVTFDLLSSDWPADVPSRVDAAVTSHCFHHIPDERKRTLFIEVFGRLRPGGWFFNFDPVQTDDPTVRELWNRVGALLYPEVHHYWPAARRSPAEQEAFENHIRHVSGLDLQLGFLREAGFEAVETYWKQIDYAIYGGRRPL